MSSSKLSRHYLTFGGLVLTTLLAVACGDDDDDSLASGGSGATGGKSAASGGKSSSGGNSAGGVAGHTASSGGSSPTSGGSENSNGGTTETGNGGTTDSSTGGTTVSTNGGTVAYGGITGAGAEAGGGTGGTSEGGAAGAPESLGGTVGSGGTSSSGGTTASGGDDSSAGNSMGGSDSSVGGDSATGGTTATPCGGCAVLNATFTASSQHYGTQIILPGNPVDVSGTTPPATVTARIRLVSGASDVGFQLFAQDTDYHSRADFPWTAISTLADHQWHDITYDIFGTGFDPSKLLKVELQLSSGGTVGWPDPIEVEVDSVTFSSAPTQPGPFTFDTDFAPLSYDQYTGNLATGTLTYRP